jgi:hypothetical protein
MITVPSRCGSRASSTSIANAAARAGRVHRCRHRDQGAAGAGEAPRPPFDPLRDLGCALPRPPHPAAAPWAPRYRCLRRRATSCVLPGRGGGGAPARCPHRRQAPRRPAAQDAPARGRARRGRRVGAGGVGQQEQVRPATRGGGRWNTRRRWRLRRLRPAGAFDRPPPPARRCPQDRAAAAEQRHHLPAGARAGGPAAAGLAGQAAGRPGGAQAGRGHRRGRAAAGQGLWAGDAGGRWRCSWSRAGPQASVPHAVLPAVPRCCRAPLEPMARWLAGGGAWAAASEPPVCSCWVPGRCARSVGQACTVRATKPTPVHPRARAAGRRAAWTCARWRRRTRRSCWPTAAACRRWRRRRWGCS